ncbi:MAG: N-6 DNA methylase [Kofleriaceae bacterium]|nr:N-6 DNA methylase [Kofleriaceae bacterium]
MVTHATRPAPGVVYTPRDVCEPMVRLALAPLLEGKSADEILRLRVCDPAIGEGAFLVEIVRVIAEALARKRGYQQSAKRLVAERCVFGIDIDGRAVAAARAAVETFVGEPVRALRENLRVGDALTSAWPERFDALVGNPPYVRQELLANKAALRAFEAYDGVADLYVYFIELAQRIADRWCLVVPNKWLTVAYGRKLRALLARESCVEGIVDFARGIPLFADADAFPCIVWGGRRPNGQVRTARVISPISVADALASVEAATRHDRLTDAPWHLDARDDDTALIDRLVTQFPPLSTVVPERPSRGIVTGLNKAFVIDRATRDAIVDDEPAAAELIRPFIKGRDVRRWQPVHADRHVLLVDRGTPLDALPRVRAHLAQFRTALEPKPIGHRGEWAGRKPGPYRWYELQDPVVPLAKSRAPRLFYQDIQTSPACCLDPSGELVPDTTVWILPSADPLLLAILNSPLYAWYAQRRFPPALNGAVRPKLEYMRALPIAQPARSLRSQITSLVEAQLREPEPARDATLAELVLEAYALTTAERALV